MKITTSYLFVVGILGALTAGIVSDWLVKRKGVTFGRRFIAVISMGMIGALILVAAITTSSVVVVISLIAAHFFYLPSVITSFATCVDIGGDNAGTVAGIMNCFGQLGAFFMAVVFGKIVDITHSFTTPLFILSGVLFLGCLLWLLVNAGRTILNVEAGDK